jgi:hypothetical protein
VVEVWLGDFRPALRDSRLLEAQTLRCRVPGAPVAGSYDREQNNYRILMYDMSPLPGGFRLVYQVEG